MNSTRLSTIIKTYPGLSPEMAACLDITRRIGSVPDLVLHGGGNTSVKTEIKDIFGDNLEVLYVKASGADMAGISPDGFTGLRLAPLQKLRRLKRLSDREMINQLSLNKLNAGAPAPSVEALLHAFLPARYIVHTHADAILALTNRKNGRDLVQEVLGENVIAVDYEASGLPLAVKTVTAWEEQPGADTIVVLHHGIFTMAETADQACALMSDRVERAAAWLRQRQPEETGTAPVATCEPAVQARLVQIIRGVCETFRSSEPSARSGSFLVKRRAHPDMTAASLAPEARMICHSGVLTPDHAIRTKNQYVYIDHIPGDDLALTALIRDQVTRYRDRYRQYLDTHAEPSTPDAPDATPDVAMDISPDITLDALPRVFLVAGMGLVTLGTTPAEAGIAADIAEHTIQTKRLCGLDNYLPISEDHVFAMEYWPLQQDKLKSSQAPLLSGKIALITGAAGAIGFGIADRLLAAGAVVAATDIDAAGLEKARALLADKYGADRVAAILFDVTDYDDTVRAMETVSLTFGGLDILVPNAGTAHVATIEELDPDIFQKVTSVNLMGCFNTIKAAVPLFRRQGVGGHIVVISSKNVFDPGAAFGAYSASKAAAHQISKIAALELAELGVRVNMVNPDAVFGDEAMPSKLWEMIGPDRMKARGLDPEGLKEYYRRRNLLKVPVYAEHVGNAVVFFAAGLTPTTGATLPVDGGVGAAFPR